MKKIILIAAIYLSFVANSYAQTHSDLWHKIDSLKQALYPEQYNNPIHTYSKYGLHTNHPCIVIDGSKAWSNKKSNYILDEYNLGQIAGINYFPIGDPTARAIYGNLGVGTILIYTHAYANAHPTIRREFKITFPAPELPENKNKKKK
ncbi:MAG: hypothetical protein SFU27_07060 [Thermonemataceae bacterium]|nr:hypothetical protein [Thermonemataceae bacterium]